MQISIIAAIGKNRELGKDNKLLWHIPEDLKRFKKLTQGHAVIMGRKTFESLGKPLPQRTNIIITKDKSFKVEYVPINRLIDTKVVVCHSLEEAIKNSELIIQDSKLPNEIFIIGGGQIYTQGIKYADKLYLTIVDGGPYEADTFFPDYSEFKRVVKEEKGESEGYKYKFVELER